MDQVLSALHALSHDMDHKKKMIIVVSQSPRVLDLKKPKMADLPKRQLNLSHIIESHLYDALTSAMQS